MCVCVVVVIVVVASSYIKINGRTTNQEKYKEKKKFISSASKVQVVHWRGKLMGHWRLMFILCDDGYILFYMCGYIIIIKYACHWKKFWKMMMILVSHSGFIIIFFHCLLNLMNFIQTIKKKITCLQWTKRLKDAQNSNTNASRIDSVVVISKFVEEYFFVVVVFENFI